MGVYLYMINVGRDWGRGVAGIWRDSGTSIRSRLSYGNPDGAVAQARTLKEMRAEEARGPEKARLQ